MGVLDPRQLTQLQTFAATTFDQPGIKIQRPTRVFDGQGTYTETWATIATVNGGWTKPSPQIMQQYAGLIGSLAAWVVRLPYGTNIKNNDRLVMPGAAGDTLTVQADLGTRSYATTARVLATEVR